MPLARLFALRAVFDDALAPLLTYADLCRCSSANKSGRAVAWAAAENRRREWVFIAGRGFLVGNCVDFKFTGAEFEGFVARVYADGLNNPDAFEVAVAGGAGAAAGLALDTLFGPGLGLTVRISAKDHQETTAGLLVWHWPAKSKFGFSLSLCAECKRVGKAVQYDATPSVVHAPGDSALDKSMVFAHTDPAAVLALDDSDFELCEHDRPCASREMCQAGRSPELKKRARARAAYQYSLRHLLADY